MYFFEAALLQLKIVYSLIILTKFNGIFSCETTVEIVETLNNVYHAQRSEYFFFYVTNQCYVRKSIEQIKTTLHKNVDKEQTKILLV